MRRAPEASSSPRRLCPGAPYGLKVSAGGLERRAAAGRLRAQGEEAGGGRPVQPGQKFGRSGAVCGGPPRLRSGSPPTFRRAARPAVGVGPPGRRRRRGGLSLPRAPRAARAGILAGGAGGRGRAASPRSAERGARTPRSRSFGGRPAPAIPGGPFLPGSRARNPGARLQRFRPPGREKGCFWQLCICATCDFSVSKDGSRGSGRGGCRLSSPTF